MKTCWGMLSPHQQEAAKTAADLVEDAELKFVMMLFRHDDAGAIVSNIDPAGAVRLIESALIAARAKVDVEEIAAGRPN